MKDLTLDEAVMVVGLLRKESHRRLRLAARSARHTDEIFQNLHDQPEYEVIVEAIKKVNDHKLKLMGKL